MGLLDNTFDTSQILDNRRMALANAAAERASGRGAVALAASGRERINQGVNSMMGIENPEVKNANMLQGILQKHTNIRTSSDAMAAANDLLNAGFTEYAQQMITNATAMRNSEAQMINANKVTGTTTDPNIAKKRQDEIDAANWVGKETLKPGYEDTLEIKKKQLAEMKGKGWMGTDAYDILLEEITTTEENNVSVEKSINDDVKVFGDRWNKVNIPQTEAALNRMEKLIFKYTGADGSGNLPGINFIEKFKGNTLQSDKDAEVIQALAAIENALLKERSGAAVTESEYNRFLKEVQAGFADDAAVIRFIQEYRTALEKEKSAIAGAFRPQVRNKYWKQSGWYKTYQNKEDVVNLPIGTYYFSPDGVLRQKQAKKEDD